VSVAETVIGTDEAEFVARAERHRHELQVHCYRMVGSYTDAEDLVQETLLRAWRGRSGFEGRASFRAWLYRIATNACLDALDHSNRRVRPVGSATAVVAAAGAGTGTGTRTGAGVDLLAERTGLQPYPDQALDHVDTQGVLDRIGPSGDEPEATVIGRETIELALLAAIQQLPPRQRALLIARDLLGWSSVEAAELLDLSVASANSLVQRARAALRRHHSAGWLHRSPTVTPTADELALLDRYMAAHERGDAGAIVALLRDDVSVTMPPEAPCRGVDEVAAFFGAILGTDGPGEWRLVPVRANRQVAVANYLRRPGDTAFRALSIDVLRIEDGRLAEINCFLDETLFLAFDLPFTL
jgi:RNA polymerase sigma-70 factor (ECF subfamily)